MDCISTICSRKFSERSNLKEKTNMEERKSIFLDTEAIESAMRHFRKVVLEGKHPNNNLQMIDIASIIARNKSLRKHSQKQLQKLINAIKKFGFLL